MTWMDSLRGKVIALDTAPLIYFLEEHPRYFPTIEPFFRALDASQLRVVTSTITLAEVLVHPLRNGNQSLVNDYTAMLLHTRDVETVPLTADIARQTAVLRSRYKIKIADAVQVATAIVAKADAILTNDTGLRAQSELKTYVIDELT